LQRSLEVFAVEFNFRIVVQIIGGITTAIETDVTAFDGIDGEGASLEILLVLLIRSCSKFGGVIVIVIEHGLYASNEVRVVGDLADDVTVDT
jgi:hypothetical protein